MQFATYSHIEIIGLIGMLKLEQLEISEQINEHAKAKVSIYIEPNYEKERFCLENAGKEISIKVNQELLFCGYVSRIQNISEHGLHIYEVEVSSYSQRLDCRKKSRSYQRISFSYEKIVELILEDYDNAFVMWENTGTETIGMPLFQYAETDWEFIKRIASIHGKGIIASTYRAFPYLMIDVDYHSQDIEKGYRYLECVLTEEHMKEYHKIECAKNYHLGSLLSIGEGVFKIIQKSIKVVDAELKYIYYLVEKDIMIVSEIYNKKLAGLQLSGTVDKVKEDKLKVQLDIDKEWGRTAEYYFDWKPISSNIMYAMPEENERVYLRLGDVRGQQVSVINCMRQNGNNCADTVDSSCKLMHYENKRMKLAIDKIDFSSITDQEIQAALSLIDVEGILAQTKAQMSMAMHKALLIHSKTGKVTITAPFQIVLRDSLNDSDAEIAINQTIECQGDVVQIEAGARIEYPAINDAPIEIRRNWGKLLAKVVTAVVVVAVVAVVAAAVTVVSGGTALGAIGYVVGCACIGGGITAAFAVGAKANDDKKKGIERNLGDYAYLFLDQFCTGAILAAPMATPFGLPAQLLGVGVCSFTYQGIDRYLDDIFGGDFYDEDSNMLLNVFFDVAFAGIASKITSIFRNITKSFANRLLYIKKSETVILARLWNKIPFVPKLSLKNADININKKIVRDALAEFSEKIQKNPVLIYLLLGGKEPILGISEGEVGADVFSSYLTDPNTNKLLKVFTDFIQNLAINSEYEFSYMEYDRIIYDDGDIGIIDFDEDGNLVFE